MVNPWTCLHACKESPVRSTIEGEGRYPLNFQQDLRSQSCPSVEMNALQSFSSHIPNALGAQGWTGNSRKRIRERKKTRKHYLSYFPLRDRFYEQSLKACNFNFRDAFLQQIQFSWTWIIRIILPEKKSTWIVFPSHRQESEVNYFFFPLALDQLEKLVYAFSKIIHQCWFNEGNIIVG